MLPTRRLYENDPYLTEFTAAVVACRPDQNAPGCSECALDATAFYPEGGGQPCDLGLLQGQPVLAVRMDGDGVVWHRTARPLAAGTAAAGSVDWERRFDFMQQHTGEHILSGTLHRMFGAENVGFHIGSPWVRMDMSLPLTAGQLAEAERAANAAVQADRPVRCWYPAPEELAALTYRSKKEISGPVRLADAGGADLCACCGTHVASAGQVGVIKIVSAQNYKGGVRLAVACGQRALAEMQLLQSDAQAAGALLSVPAGQLAGAAKRLLDAQAADRQRIAALQGSLADALAAAAQPGRTAVFFLDGPDGDGLRRIAVTTAARTGALCAALAPGGQGLAYALAAPEGGDVRELCRRLNAQFSGRGGGKPGFCQGSLPAEADRQAVETFLRRS
ncbi:MAG TPA: alanyl-tRNA editing protein [Candidatus Gemmiger faecigallinarum]|nr:alanyl-tRNA editing protein [Candidatus Gemmiger faecigallinarum]